MSHTPAPWVIASGGSKSLGGQYVLTEWFVRRPNDDMAIAADIIDPETGEPSETNARLIAAAPELLAALESITEFCTIKHRKGEGHEWQVSQYQLECVQAAIDLIAKVKGGNDCQTCVHANQGTCCGGVR